MLGARLARLARISGNGTRRAPKWSAMVRKLPAGHAGKQLSIELVAADVGRDAMVEIGVDQVRVTRH